jgi:phage terminase large subunit-like protein
LLAARELVRPAFLSVPPHASTAGPECADLAASAGMDFDEEQRLAVDAVLAETPTGAWAAFEGALIGSRQNFKTHCLKGIALHRLFLLQDRLTVWTAHEFATAMEAFRDITAAIEGAPHLSRKVKTVCNTNGEEGVELHSGARLIFRARSKRAGRGLSGNTVILDEAFALMPHHMGSLLPTLSAVPNSQVLYGSSAGHLQSSILRRIRDRGRAGDDPSLAYVEWCAPEGGCASHDCDHRLDATGCALDDEDRWLQANPALDRRITRTAIRGERRALPPQEFARERLGWWEDPPDGASDKISPQQWSAAADIASQIVSTPAFVVDVTPDRARASFAAGGLRSDGKVHGEVIRNAAGTGWLVELVAAATAKAGVKVVHLDATGPAGSLIPAFEARGLTVEVVSARDLAQACGGLVDLVAQDRFRHIDQPELNDALAGAATRDLGDGAWAWSRRSSLVDISPLVAVTVASHRCGNAPKPTPNIF